MSVTFVGEGAPTTALNNGGTYSVAMPAGVAADDLLVLVCAFNSGSSLVSTPSGWAISAAAGGETPPKNFSGVPYAYHKVAGASEPSLSITTNANGGGQNSHFVVLAFRGTHATTPVNASAYNGSDQNPSAGGNITFPQVTTTVTDCTLFALTSETQNHTATLTPGSGYTSTGSHSALQPSFMAGYKLTSGAAGNYTPVSAVVTEASRTFRTLTLAFAPAASASPDVSGTVVADDGVASGAMGILTSSMTGTVAADDSVASGTMAIAGLSAITGTVIADDAMASGALGVTVPATIISGEFKSTSTKSLVGAATFDHAVLLRVSDRHPATSVAAPTTASDSRMTITSVGMTAGVDYMLVVWNVDGTLAGVEKVTAA